MNAYSFLFPMIVAMPRGYDLTVVVPTGSVEQYLAVKDCDLICDYQIRSEGEVVKTVSRTISFRGGKFSGSEAEFLVMREEEFANLPGPAYLEFSMYEPNQRPVFTERIVHGWYSIYAKAGKKSFFSDNAVKYGSPPIISMIAQFRKYVDGYPVVHIDRKRDLGESILLINPYGRPIMVDVHSHDARKLPRLKVPGGSARWVDLGDLLAEGEDEWLGQVQITASNRLVTFETKHRLSDKTIISDHEHLDPYRADPTHIPATLKMRILAGAAVRTLKSALARRSA
jgi:hypothetical protein